MNKLPAVALQPKDAGDADGYERKVRRPADLRLPALVLDHDREIVGRVGRDEVGAGYSSVTIMRRRARQCGFNVSAPARERTERVAERHVVSL